ncbi:unnamed protein product [Linum trigynum]|uniref:Uncharacterized protein n=1 Tax=Linum trigynum TaxID=586398 RepID=A0AAV2DU69_9ROSI
MTNRCRRPTVPVVPVSRKPTGRFLVYVRSNRASLQPPPLTASRPSFPKPATPISPSSRLLRPPPPDDRRRPLANQPRRMVPSHSRSPLLHDNLSASNCDSIESARRSDARRRPGPVVAPCDEGDEESEEEDGARDGNETESFRYSSRSFSFDDTSCECNRAGEMTGSENEEVRLLRWAADDGGEERILNPTDMRRQVLMGLRSSSSAGELGGGESMGEVMAVVRKSTDPKGDCKRSMDLGEGDLRREEIGRTVGCCRPAVSGDGFGRRRAEDRLDT